ncbi:MAG: cytochrome d ubiquinol oxidase subunit II [Deltaproteobacteria bacterium]|nr:cytochrome d ubiquinol oxidase subunit II [Deltaproteobacteria bacterium]
MDLNTLWFILVAVLLAGYAVLDGFDLGVGVLHLFTREEDAKRVNLKAIGPVWDGNEVWLLTGGGAMFAAFPAVYATVFSGFYLALMLLLLALILRAVSMEFRNLVDSPRWHQAWDLAFGIGSLLPSILFGVAVGNVLRGVPVDEGGNWTGSFLGLLNPYSILVGLLSLAAFVTHGALYLRLKADGAHAGRMGKVAMASWVGWAVLYAAATVATGIVSPQLFKTGHPLFWVFSLLLAAGLAGVPVMLRKGRDLLAFLASAVTLVAMIAHAGLGLFPRLVPSITHLDYSLTIYNASSTPRTLAVMLVIALIGMPLVIGYTAVIYRIFRGKVTAQSQGY